MGKCPYCEANLTIDDLSTEMKRTRWGFLVQYSCSKCDKILGISESRSE